MIGYNIGKINELLQTLANNYNTLGQKMEEGWPNVANTMSTNWVGPDEDSSEQILADNIVDLYLQSKSVITGVIKNISQLGEDWKIFQQKNVMEGAAVDVINVSIEVPTLTTYPINATVKATKGTYSSTTNFGLQSADAASKIDNALQTYIDDVYANVKAMYENLDASKAFIGGSQSQAVSGYVNKLGESIAKLVTCHKSIKDNLQKQATAYQNTESQLQAAVGAANVDLNYNGENLK